MTESEKELLAEHAREMLWNNWPGMIWGLMVAVMFVFVFSYGLFSIAARLIG